MKSWTWINFQSFTPIIWARLETNGAQTINDHASTVSLIQVTLAVTMNAIRKMLPSMLIFKSVSNCKAPVWHLSWSWALWLSEECMDGQDDGDQVNQSHLYFIEKFKGTRCYPCSSSWHMPNPHGGSSSQMNPIWIPWDWRCSDLYLKDVFVSAL